MFRSHGEQNTNKANRTVCENANLDTLWKGRIKNKYSTIVQHYSTIENKYSTIVQLRTSTALMYNTIVQLKTSTVL